MRDLDARSFAALLLLPLLQTLHVERLEGDRAEQHRREAAARDEVRDGLAQVREQDRRARHPEEWVELLGWHVAHREDARLYRLGEEDRLVVAARGDGRRDRHLVIDVGELRRRGVDLYFDLRLHLRHERLGCVRNLEREILDVDLLDLEAGLLRLRLWCRLLQFAHGEPSRSGSSLPSRSRAYRSAQPPTWRSPIQICGTVRRPLFCIISARRAGSRSTRIFSMRTPFSSSSRSAD